MVEFTHDNGSVSRCYSMVLDSARQLGRVRQMIERGLAEMSVGIVSSFCVACVAVSEAEALDYLGHWKNQLRVSPPAPEALCVLGYVNADQRFVPKAFHQAEDDTDA